MEKRFLIVTSPVNEDLTKHKDFIKGLKASLDISLTKDNSYLITDIAFPASRVHFFEFGDFIGSIAVVEEERDRNERISNSH
jgi:hypothetical protein